MPPRKPHRNRILVLAAVVFVASGIAFLATAPVQPATATPPIPAPAPKRLSGLDSLVAVESRVHWMAGPPDTAIAVARTEARPVFLDFYADWCVPCKWMDRYVYNDPLLAETSEGVAMVRVDIDGAEGKALAQRYDIRQYPTLVWLGPDGAERLRWVGPLSLRDTRMNLGQASLPSSQRTQFEAIRKEKPDDLSAQTAALLFYGYRGEVERVRTLAADLDKRWTKRPASDFAAVRLSLGKAEEIAGRADRALAAYRTAVEVDPEGPFAWRAWLGISACEEAKKDRAAALGAAQKAAEKGPRLPYLDARRARLALNAPPMATPPGVDDSAGGQ